MGLLKFNQSQENNLYQSSLLALLQFKEGLVKPNVNIKYTLSPDYQARGKRFSSHKICEITIGLTYIKVGRRLDLYFN